MYYCTKKIVFTHWWSRKDGWYEPLSLVGMLCPTNVMRARGRKWRPLPPLQLRATTSQDRVNRSLIDPMTPFSKMVLFRLAYWIVFIAPLTHFFIHHRIRKEKEHLLLYKWDATLLGPMAYPTSIHYQSQFYNPPFAFMRRRPSSYQHHLLN